MKETHTGRSGCRSTNPDYPDSVDYAIIRLPLIPSEQARRITSSREPFGKKCSLMFRTSDMTARTTEHSTIRIVRDDTD